MSVAIFAVDLTTAPVLVGVAALAAVALAAIWQVPKLQARRWAASGISGKELADLENGARSTLVQIVGGVALILTFAATWMQIADARKAANRTLRLSAAQQETDRFTRAIEQLGSKQFELRLGGIYSLERVGIDAPRERRAIVQIMLAYLHRQHPAKLGSHPRDPWVREGPGAPPYACFSHQVKAPEDRQAALDVALGFARSAGIDHLDLARTNLNGVRARGGELSHADMRDSWLLRAHLDYARLDHAILDHTDLRYACLKGADLRDTILNFTTFDFADLSGADLRGAQIGIATDIRRALISPCTRRPAHPRVPKRCGAG